MLRQIALFLLILCLTAPAVAAPLCHQPVRTAQSAQDEAITAAHAAMGHAPPAAPDRDDTPASNPNKAPHGCIGCAAPIGRMAMPAHCTLLPLTATATLLRALHGVSTPPALPPPRP